MAECVNDSDAESTINYGDYVVLKRGDVFKSVQVENKKWVLQLLINVIFLISLAGSMAWGLKNELNLHIKETFLRYFGVIIFKS